MSSSAAARSAPNRDQRIPAFVNPESPNTAAARAALLEDGRFIIHDLSQRDMRAQIESAVGRGARRLVIAGGDGTLGTAAAAVLDTETELAVIPAGTLNHFAIDHGIPEKPDEAIAAVFAGAVKRVDVGVVSDIVFLNTASAGLYVSYVRSRERIERFVGYRAASVAALVANILRPRTVSVELKVEGETKHYRTPLLFVGVGERELKAPKFGGRLEGGRRGLHVMVVRKSGLLALLRLATAASSRGVHAVAESSVFDSFIVESCLVRVRRRQRVTLGLDGELLRVPAPLEFTIRRDALRVVAASPPADLPREP
jgi:diacylglycerol kinase family enzyme